MHLHVIILAAGRGKRMKSDIAKVQHPLGGVPMLERVVRTAQALHPQQIHIIYGNHGDHLKDELNYLPVNWVFQKEQKGTGHAVMQALPFCKKGERVLVLYGDVPLISEITLKQLLKETPENGLGLVVAEFENPTGLGRIVRNEMGNIVAIVEEKDANAQEKQIREINTGILTATTNHLKEWLPKLKTSNRQQEYYLTDIVELAVKDGIYVGGVFAHCSEEVQGVNDRWQLTALERYYQKTLAKELALSGVTIQDPSRLDIRGEVAIAKDVTLDINILLEGKIKIGKYSHIGANVVLKNVEIGRHVVIKPNTIIEEAKIADGCIIGPFARIRPETVLSKNVHVGNFVEIKKSTLGEGAKANHLTYLGDASVGKKTNVGAGTITCNYDGANKHKTIIGENAFIGSNTALVAPVKIGKNATIGAGSVITKNTPANELTLSRAKQITIKDWKRPKKK